MAWPSFDGCPTSIEGPSLDTFKNLALLAFRKVTIKARRLQASDLPRFFARLPSLGDDAESFARDLELIRREVPRESDPWA